MMAIRPLSAERATSDIVGLIINDMKLLIEEGINTGDFTKFDAPFNYFDQLSASSKERFINEGSYISSLSFSMRQGDFQKVLNALENLSIYPQFQTSAIHLCKAACLFKLERRDECETLIWQCKDEFDVDKTLEIMIASCRSNEKKAYKDLLGLCRT